MSTIRCRIAVLSLLAAASIVTSIAPASAQEWETGVVPPLPPPYCSERDDRTEVLLLGSYHMANPGADRFNLEADDVLTPERQRQVESLVDRLAEFAPTKVAIESAWGDTLWPGRYRNYLADDFERGPNEREQIGFRLAAAAGHATIYPIDARMGLPFEQVQQLAATGSVLAERFAGLQEYGEWAMELLDGWLREGTVGEMLHRMNTPEAISGAHVGYLEYLAPIVKGDDYAGADLVADWYKRNIRIFSNLTRITDDEDRIFVLFGAGHVPILRQLLIDSREYCVEDPLPYLGPR